MKTNSKHRKSASIAKPRWVAYAAAGAATALSGSHSLEAAIHYSGRVNVPFPPDESVFKSFQLDQSDALEFKHGQDIGFAGFRITSYKSTNFAAGFRGRSYFVSKLSFGQNISEGFFSTRLETSLYAVMASGSRGQWTRRGVGYVGFRFKTDAGFQYGWARIGMGGVKNNNEFKVLDYAYADPGEAIRAGQTSSDEQAVEQNSLGWLALGAVGLIAWRKTRPRDAR